MEKVGDLAESFSCSGFGGWLVFGSEEVVSFGGEDCASESVSPKPGGRLRLWGSGWSGMVLI